MHHYNCDLNRTDSRAASPSPAGPADPWLKEHERESMASPSAGYPAVAPPVPERGEPLESEIVAILGLERDDFGRGWWLPGDPGPVLCKTTADAVREADRLSNNDRKRSETTLADLRARAEKAEATAREWEATAREIGAEQQPRDHALRKSERENADLRAQLAEAREDTELLTWLQSQSEVTLTRSTEGCDADGEEVAAWVLDTDDGMTGPAIELRDVLRAARTSATETGEQPTLTGPEADRLLAAISDPESAEAYYEAIRHPLLYYFGTTDVEMLTEIWARQAKESDERAARASVSPGRTDTNREK